MGISARFRRIALPHPRFHERSVPAVMLVAALVYALAGCASPPVEPYAGQASRLETLYVIAGGWHTEIGLPAHAMTGSLVALKEASPGSPYFVFGWGQRHYYVAQNPGLGELLEALVPAPAVMLVIPLNRPPSEFFTADSSVFAVRVSQDGLDRLSQFLWGYLEKDPDRIPHRLGEGPYPGSSFYELEWNLQSCQYLQYLDGRSSSRQWIAGQRGWCRFRPPSRGPGAAAFRATGETRRIMKHKPVVKRPNLKGTPPRGPAPWFRYREKRRRRRRPRRRRRRARRLRRC